MTQEVRIFYEVNDKKPKYFQEERTDEYLIWDEKYGLKIRNCGTDYEKIELKTKINFKKPYIEYWSKKEFPSIESALVKCNIQLKDIKKRVKITKQRSLCSSSCGMQLEECEFYLNGKKYRSLAYENSINLVSIENDLKKLNDIFIGSYPAFLLKFA